MLIAKLHACTFAALTLVGVHTPGVRAGQTSDFLARTQWSSGEENAATLDDIRNGVLGIGPSGVSVPAIEGSIIIVAHLGVAERSRLSNWRRLYNVREYLMEHGIPPERIVAAEGVTSRSRATVEIFLGGRLRLTITADRNKDIRVDCCQAFTQYYPWRKGRLVLQ